MSPQVLVTGPPPSSLSVLVLEVKISNASSTLHGKKKHGPLKGAGPLGLVFIYAQPKLCAGSRDGVAFPWGEMVHRSPPERATLQSGAGDTGLVISVPCFLTSALW